MKSTSRLCVLLIATALTTLGLGCSPKSDPEAPLVNDATPTKMVSNDPGKQDEVDQIPVYGYQVVKTFPHDPMAFTQGLVFHDGYFLEGTGLEGRSSLRKVEISTGKVLQKIDIDSKYFGEGITLFKDKIYQITWQTNQAFEYDLETFKRLKSFTYSTEGWGITHDGTKLIMSDGTATLYFRDPETFKEIGKVTVKDDNGEISLLNELEYIKGEIYANIWGTNTIARIDPKTGKVVGWIDLTGLLKPEDMKPGHQVDVLNGIAYDEKADRLFVTGKLWPKLYEIKLVKK
ncbi:MAG: glutaminyl-peptide cyclotransferase [Fimbriimonadaceae bacterium]|nr:glutaminyl-peptide cyclotransferase [Fimbriimonadaceae bacterium]